METQTTPTKLGGSPWLIGVKKAAELMSVSYRQMYTIANIEGFPSLRIGSRIMIDPLKLRQWIDDHMGGDVAVGAAEREQSPEWPCRRSATVPKSDQHEIWEKV